MVQYQESHLRSLFMYRHEFKHLKPYENNLGNVKAMRSGQFQILEIHGSLL